MELLAKDPARRPAHASHVIAALQALHYTPTVIVESAARASPGLDLGSPGRLGNAVGFQSTVTGLTGTPPVQPASFARVPRTEAERRQVLLARDIGWEYAHLAGQLLYERDSAEAKHRSREIRYSSPSVRAATAEDIVSCVEYIDRRFNDLMALVDSIGTKINMNDKAALEYAFGASGQDGDPDRLAQLAKRWNAVYEGFLDWAASVRSFNAPSELRNLLAIAARYADEPVEKYRLFVDAYAAQVDGFPVAIAAGKPLRIEGSITLDSPDEVIRDYKAELNHLRSRLGI